MLQSRVPVASARPVARVAVRPARLRCVQAQALFGGVKNAEPSSSELFNFSAKGFTVLGFPCNQFGAQEPGNNQSIKSSAKKKYGVIFPLMSKVDVNGLGGPTSTAAVSTAADQAASCSSEQEAALAWEDLDVAVVGGGPAGLAAALALLTVRPDLKLKVFEASPGYTVQGAGVGLFLNGVRALEALHPGVLHRLVRQGTFTCGGYQYNDETGERMPWVRGSDPRENFDKGTAACLVHWNQIRTALYDQMPEGTVEFGCKVMAVSRTAGSPPGDQSALAEGESETQQSGPRYVLDITRTSPEANARAAGGDDGVGDGFQKLHATARYVIAADGYFSRVRRTAGDGKSPISRELLRWLGTFSRSDLGSVPLPGPLADPKTALGFHVWAPVTRDKPLQGPPPRALVVHSAGAAVQGGPEMLVWYVWAPAKTLEGEEGAMAPRGEAADSKEREQSCTAENRAAAKAGDTAGGASVHDDGASAGGRKQTGAVALQRALKAASHLPAELRAMLAATQPERVTEFGVYLHSRDSIQPGAWVRDGLVLLGDAAHAGVPDGQGANLALEDAVVLADMVRQHGLGQKAFDLWEAARQPRVLGIQHDTSPSGAIRMPLIASAAFEPLWCPLQLASLGGLLPEDVAAEVRAAVAGGGVEKGREVVLAWSREEVRRAVEDKVAGRFIPEDVAPPPGTYRLR